MSTVVLLTMRWSLADASPPYTKVPKKSVPVGCCLTLLYLACSLVFGLLLQHRYAFSLNVPCLSVPFTCAGISFLASVFEVCLKRRRARHAAEERVAKDVPEPAPPPRVDDAAEPPMTDGEMLRVLIKEMAELRAQVAEQAAQPAKTIYM